MLFLLCKAFPQLDHLDAINSLTFDNCMPIYSDIPYLLHFMTDCYLLFSPLLLFLSTGSRSVFRSVSSPGQNGTSLFRQVWIERGQLRRQEQSRAEESRGFFKCFTSNLSPPTTSSRWKSARHYEVRYNSRRLDYFSKMRQLKIVWYPWKARHLIMCKVKLKQKTFLTRFVR